MHIQMHTHAHTPHTHRHTDRHRHIHRHNGERDLHIEVSSHWGRSRCPGASLGMWGCHHTADVAARGCRRTGSLRTGRPPAGRGLLQPGRRARGFPQAVLPSSRLLSKARASALRRVSGTRANCVAGAGSVHPSRCASVRPLVTEALQGRSLSAGPPAAGTACGAGRSLGLHRWATTGSDIASTQTALCSESRGAPRPAPATTAFPPQPQACLSQGPRTMSAPKSGFGHCAGCV